MIGRAGMARVFASSRAALAGKLHGIVRRHRVMPFIQPIIQPKRLSCGIVIFGTGAEVLLCHVTGRDHWDLPKGGIGPGETPLQAALRETREETGLAVAAAALRELGRFEFGAKKDLHLFAARLPGVDLSTLHCESHFAHPFSGRRLPEMDGYGWFGFDQIAARCTPKMTAVLTGRLNLQRLCEELAASADERSRRLPALAA